MPLRDWQPASLIFTTGCMLIAVVQIMSQTKCHGGRGDGLSKEGNKENPSQHPTEGNNLFLIVKQTELSLPALPDRPRINAHTVHFVFRAA
eukprot:1143701-Pelagomonas_calceolata.AAC.4